MHTQTKYTTLSSPKTPKSAKGLAASKYAEEDDVAPANSDAVEGEHDSSSAALASVRQPSPNLVFVLDHLLTSSSQFFNIPSCTIANKNKHADRLFLMEIVSES